MADTTNLEAVISEYLEKENESINSFTHAMVAAMNEWTERHIPTSTEDVDEFCGRLDSFYTLFAKIGSNQSILFSKSLTSDLGISIMVTPAFIKIWVTYLGGESSAHTYIRTGIEKAAEGTYKVTKGFIEYMFSFKEARSRAAINIDSHSELVDPDVKAIPNFVPKLTEVASDSITLLDRYQELLELFTQPASVIADMSITEFNDIIKELQTLHENISPDKLINAFLEG